MKEVNRFLQTSQLNRFIFLKRSSVVVWLGVGRWCQPTAECLELHYGN